ncbi:MAG: hypothetical protein IM473_22385 [Microcystis sp. M015S2]|uniref:hypothetical protein n=1 Tax=unclassified Microcystis TaxID=2643300 RepID=UPI0025826AAF|nr:MULTISPECIES: hypothetical protein [unclassified Microcystis]MCA2711768.1 hypothetical protein [Microcystis sp. M025S2]MCA2745041.1 hypothetical protein [Microcystis sp. M015S2]MCA2760539.1 hypothetical protein [Microcystis sp. M145S2]
MGLAGAVFAVVDIGIWIICILVLLLIPPKTRKIISHMYLSIFTEDSKEIAALRDGEGSLKKIWYKGIDKQNEDVKSTRIFWIKPIRYFIPLYQIVKSMIDHRDNAIIEIENDSLKSKLQTLDEFRLANQVQNTKVLMQAQGADKQDLLNELINNLFEHIQNQEVKSTRMYQIVESMIDDRDNAIIQIENGSLKSRLQTLDEFRLANQVQNTKVLMQAQGANKQNLLNELINDCFKNLLNKIQNYSRNPEYNPSFGFDLDNGGRKDVNNIPELLELCIDNPNKFKEHMDRGDFERWLDNIEIRETELANIAQATREKTFPNDNERLHYFLRECCLVLIGRNP